MPTHNSAATATAVATARDTKRWQEIGKPAKRQIIGRRGYPAEAKEVPTGLRRTDPQERPVLDSTQTKI